MTESRPRSNKRSEPRIIRSSSFPQPLPATPVRNGRAAHDETTKKSPSRTPRATLRRWTPEEDAFLRKHYPRDGAVYCATQLGRPKSGVNHRAETLGVRSKRRKEWTSREDAMLRLQYGKMTAPRLATILKRTEESVRQRLLKLGLTEAVNRPWSGDDIAYLREHYHKVSSAVIASELGRSRDAVELKAGKIGLSRPAQRVTPKQEREIVKLLGRKEYTEIGRALNLTAKTVARVAAAHGYRARPTSRAWTAADDAELRELFPTTSDEQLAVHLNRTALAIEVRARLLGLARPTTHSRRGGVFRPWTHEEETQLRRMLKSMSHREIATKLGRSEMSINTRVSRLGLSNRGRRS